AILRALPILRHHDDRRLQSRDDSEHEVQHLIGQRIEAAHQNVRVERDPKKDEANRETDEFPTATKFCQHISGPVRQGQALVLLLVDVARHALLQHLVCAAQARERMASRASSITAASADRFLPSMMAISPKKSPRASSASTISFLSSSETVMRTRPFSIRYIASPTSPARNKVVPAFVSCVRKRLRSSAAASSSSEANRGTERIASSVIS